jgi:hypothetical protein
MWVYKPEDATPIHHFFRSTLAEMWMLLFKSSENDFPSEGRDLGFEAGHDAPEVIFPYTVLYSMFL